MSSHYVSGRMWGAGDATVNTTDVVTVLMLYSKL